MSGDGDRRKKKFRRFVLRTRALVCAVAALLFVFQSVVAAAAPHSHASYDAGLSAAAAQDCQFYFQGKKGGPDHRMVREHCCLFCAAGGVGAAYFPILTTYDIELPRLNPKTSTPELVVRALARPPGWRTAWSSQAPPTLS